MVRIFHVNPALIFTLYTLIGSSLHLPPLHNPRVAIPCQRMSVLFPFKFFRAAQYFVVTGQGSPSQEEWEERILHLSMDVLSETMLGIRLSGHSFLQWRFEVLKEEKYVN